MDSEMILDQYYRDQDTRVNLFMEDIDRHLEKVKEERRYGAITFYPVSLANSSVEF